MVLIAICSVILLCITEFLTSSIFLIQYHDVPVYSYPCYFDCIGIIEKEVIRKRTWENTYYIARDTTKDTISMTDNTIKVTYYGIPTDVWDEIIEKAAANMTDITYKYAMKGV